MSDFDSYLVWCNKNNLKPQYAENLFLFMKKNKGD